MALDLDDIAVAAVEFENSECEYQAHVWPAINQTIEKLRAALPCLTEHDLAAVAYYIGGMFASLRDLPLKRAGDVITETSLGYSLGAAKILGMLG